MGIVSEAAKHLPTFEEQVESARQYRQEIMGEYLRSVWHDISDEPADRSQCLVISKRKKKDVVTYSGQFFYMGHVVAEPCKMYAMADIVKWAYIEDLIPKED